MSGPSDESARGMEWTAADRRRWRRVRLVGLVLFGAASVALARDVGRVEPQDEVASLVAVVNRNGRRPGPYRTGQSFLHVSSARAWSATFHVGRAERFAPTRFLVIERAGDQLVVELMFSAGVEGTTTLHGSEARSYLTRVDLDLSPIDTCLLPRK